MDFVSLENLDILVVEGSIWSPMKIELNAPGALDFDQTTRGLKMKSASSKDDDGVRLIRICT
jgi:hypothetical protein